MHDQGQVQALHEGFDVRETVGLVENQGIWAPQAADGECRLPAGLVTPLELLMQSSPDRPELVNAPPTPKRLESPSNDSPDSLAGQRPGQAGPGQPGLHGQGLQRPTEIRRAAPGSSEGVDAPAPPKGGQDPNKPDGGNTVRQPGALRDEQQRGG